MQDGTRWKKGTNGRRGEFFCSSTHILTALITMVICNVGYLQPLSDLPARYGML